MKERVTAFSFFFDENPVRKPVSPLLDGRPRSPFPVEEIPIQNVGRQIVDVVRERAHARRDDAVLLQS